MSATNRNFDADEEFLFGAAASAILPEPPTAPQPNSNGEFATPADGAKFMASLGIPQVPLTPPTDTVFANPGKNPAINGTGWPNKASTAFAQIDIWARKFPKCNFGSRAISELGGFYVLETDSVELNAKYEIETGRTFDAQLVIESSAPDRNHRWYAQSPESLAELRNIGQEEAKGFSLRWNNEQCVSPGSIHPNGKQYRVVCYSIPSPVRQTVEEIRWLKNQKPSASPRTAPESGEKNRIPPGGHHAALLKELGSLIHRGYSKAAASTALLLWANEWLENPGHGAPLDAHIHQMVESTTTWERGVPAVEITEKPTPTQQIEERPDISRTVLSGRLGEICEREMLDDFPVAYAWLAVLTAASVLVPERPSTGSGDNLHNLYTALVGPPNCGKSQAIEWAMKILRIQDDPRLYSEVKPGSAERLLKYMSRLAEKDKLGPRVLMFLDEWKFFFDKAKIENSTFPTLLTTGFYRRNTTILDSHGHPLMVPAAFSWIGGIVTDAYDDCLSSVTSLGLHDRLLQGINPSNYAGFNYRPFEGQMIPADFEPQSVQMDGSVWECLKAWKKTNPGGTREAEIALRVAEICASFDGAPMLYGKDLGPHLILADEQLKLRATLKPNIGESPDAQCAIKVENYLKAQTASNGWVLVRVLMRAIHAERLGPNTFKRTIEGLSYLKAVELNTFSPAVGNHPGGRPASMIRWVSE